MIFVVKIGIPSTCAKSSRVIWKSVAECTTKRKAKNYCRNNYWKHGGYEMQIVIPDGTKECWKPSCF